MRRDPPWELLTRYQAQDVSPRMAALYRLASDLGVELTELLLRSVPVVAGLSLPVSGPLAAAPLLFAVGDAVGRRSPRAWRRLTLAAGSAGLGVILVLLPAAWSLREVVGRKSGKGETGPDSWLGAPQVHAGTGSGVLTALPPSARLSAA